MDAPNAPAPTISTVGCGAAAMVVRASSERAEKELRKRQIRPFPFAVGVEPPHLDEMAYSYFPPSAVPSSPKIHAPSPRHPRSTVASPASTPTVASQLPLELQLFCVVGGGTGANSILGAFPRAIHILPISDDGGSSSEIQRVLGGGPSVGDIR